MTIAKEIAMNKVILCLSCSFSQSWPVVWTLRCRDHAAVVRYAWDTWNKGIDRATAGEREPAARSRGHYLGD